MASSGVEETLEHYLRVAFRSREDSSRAVSLAAGNVHAPVQQVLGQLGAVIVCTDEDIADVSCVYEVEGPGSQNVLVFISTLLPYAAVLVSEGRRYVRFASAGETGWPGAVVARLTERGFFVVPEAACRAKRPDPGGGEGPRISYFEALFEDEFGPPEDWSWLGDDAAEGMAPRVRAERATRNRTI